MILKSASARLSTIDEHQVGDTFIDVEGGHEGFLLPRLQALGDHRVGRAGVGRVLVDEKVARLGEIDGDDVLTFDPIGIAADAGKFIAGDARPFFAIGIARGAVDLAAPVDRVERAVDVIIRNVGRLAGDVVDEQIIIADRVAGRAVGGVLVEAAGVDVIGAAFLRRRRSARHRGRSACSARRRRRW